MSVSVTEQKHSAAFYHLKSDPLSSCGSAFLDSGPFFLLLLLMYPTSPGSRDGL